MLKQVFKQLDDWVTQENEQRVLNGIPRLPKSRVKVLGQAALIEAKIDLTLVATMDVDAYTQADWVITKKLNELLRPYGRHWDAHSSEIWMPKETEYTPLYIGQFIEAFLAKPEYVLLSKGLKAPKKNKDLILEYLSKDPSSLFIFLAAQYKLDLEQFLQ